MQSLIIRGRVTPQELNLLRKDALLYRDKAQEAGVYNKTGDNINKKVRDSLTFFPKHKDYFNTFNILESVFLEHYHWLKLEFNVPEIQYVRYHRGGFFKWHRDPVIKDETFYTRGFTMSVNLSDVGDYEGGFLKAKDPNGVVHILNKKPGSYMIFPSFYLHIAETVTKGTREAIINWPHVSLPDLDKIKEISKNYYGK